MSGTPNLRIVRALAKRDLLMYFSNPTGYVFITLFIFLSAGAAFWQDRFFLQNLANLDQLNSLFPFLLLFFIPALTMGVWSEERKLGTDELLLTLPATDLEVVLGKYAATLGIYTASLLLGLSYVLVLFYLGSPDLGLMFSNYVGYWFMGAALIAVGMLASLLTHNATIGFIVGGLFCGGLIVTSAAVGTFSPGLERLLQAVVMGPYFQDFAKGIISLTGLLYFSAVGAFFIYLNVLVLSRRHWPAKADGYPMWLHHAVRAVAIVVALLSVGAVLAARVSLRLDVTAERLHSLSGETRALIDELPPDRPVFIQAFISPEVPEPYVQARSNLISILQEIDALAGSRVEVLIHDTEPFTDAARDARETFGIAPRPFRDVSSTRADVTDVFMGLAFTCGAEEQVIGFFDRGLPTEYEVVRGIRVVAGTERKRVGVVKTMVDLVGGVDYQQNRFVSAWPVVAELRKQYDVYPIDPDLPIDVEVDALLVPLPSSLQTDQMTNVTNAIRAGTPAMLLVDPMPALDPQLSPTEWVGDGNPFTHPPGSARPGPRGNVRQWVRDLGVSWEPTRILWDSYNPHPELAHMPDDVVFLGLGNQNEHTFNVDNIATADLQELVFLWPGFLEPVEDERFEFEALLRSGTASGTNGYFSIVRSSPFGVQINPEPPRQQDEDDYVIAARIRSVSTAPAESPGETSDADVNEDTSADENEGVDVDAETAAEAAADDQDDPETSSTGTIDMIVVADLDFIGDQFFAIREQAIGDLNFDNVTFFLNAMDALVGDESFVNLRSRRARHRTLERVEAQTAQFLEQRTQDERQAEEEAEEALSEAQARLDARVEELRSRPDIDAQTMQIMVRNLEEIENRRLEVLSTNIEAEKDTKIQASRESMEAKIRQIQTSIQAFAILLPPIPVFAVGVVTLIRRRRRAREGAAAAHQLRDNS